jgi:hypothetical protein
VNAAPLLLVSKSVRALLGDLWQGPLGQRISNAVAKRVVERERYLHTFPAARLSWGLYEGRQLLGHPVFGVPSHTVLVRNVFPDLQPSMNR